MPRDRKPTKAEFLLTHPLCCFCGGRRPAVERDHAPARIVFRGKQGPDEFEFPACAECNRAMALSEQVTAFYIRSIDQTYDQLDAEEYSKLIRGIVNNAPEALPYQGRSRPPAIYTRFVAPDAGERTVSIPEVAKRHFELFGTKMLYAMYYRVTGNLASSSLRRLVVWAQAGTPAADQVRYNASQWFDDLQVATRPNVDHGNQFRYQTGHNAAHGYLGLHMSFGEAFVYFCVLGPAREMVRLRPKPELYQTIKILGDRIKIRKP
ncbi:HNH endonuclease [Sphingomonas solaris]|uniref:HNH endonuclease n=1 Tax=Alterirhizorhabdus solaris TaxID=2529389 RepID=A0A558RAZ8_9SPHN|nr:hypothetical protein [Sphingomonas solaris]TVV76452.1 hypothetical protein FOY91_04300 [Sphingomonas solaris]